MGVGAGVNRRYGMKQMENTFVFPVYLGGTAGSFPVPFQGREGFFIYKADMAICLLLNDINPGKWFDHYKKRKVQVVGL